MPNLIKTLLPVLCDCNLIKISYKLIEIHTTWHKGAKVEQKG